MASKSAYHAQEKGAEIEELLDECEKLVERLRVMYEQYFLGILKVAPSTLHTEAERRIRDITQLQIRNTALRYRFATLSQKFGAYNTYWKRTLRAIEQGRYVRDLARIEKTFEQYGEDVPAEILAKMPKLMRERVQRDRAKARAIAERQGKLPASDAAPGASPGAGEPGAPAPSRPAPNTAHRLTGLDDDIDIEAMFESLTLEAEQAIDARVAAPAPRPAAPTALQKPVQSQPPAPAQPQPRPQPTMPPPPRVVAEDFNPPTEPSGPPPDAAAPGPAPGDRGRRTSPTTPPLRAAAPMRSTTPPPPRPPNASPRPATQAPPLPGVPPQPAAPPGAGARPPVGRATPPHGSRTPSPAARPGAVAPAAKSALGPPPGMSDDDSRALYNRYLKARELVGESNDGVTYDKLLRTLRSQSSKIMTDHKAKSVEFAVVIKDNKVVLKAKPK